MFNFTTQTVFNSIVLTTESDIRDKKAPKGYNIITKDTAKGPEVRIGNVRFNREDVLDIQFKNHSAENLAKVSFDLAQAISLVTADSKDVQEGNYRIALYIGLSMNSQDAFYSNAYVYKGKPLYTINSVTTAIRQIPQLAKDVMDAEKAVAKEVQEQGTARGGNDSKSLMDDGVFSFLD